MIIDLMILLFEGLRRLKLQVQSKSRCLNHMNKRNSIPEISRLGMVGSKGSWSTLHIHSEYNINYE